MYIFIASFVYLSAPQLHMLRSFWIFVSSTDVCLADGLPVAATELSCSLSREPEPEQAAGSGRRLRHTIRRSSRPTDEQTRPRAPPGRSPDCSWSGSIEIPTEYGSPITTSEHCSASPNSSLRKRHKNHRQSYRSAG